MDALLAGKAEVVLVAETPLALAAFQEHRVVIVATITESSHKLVVLNRPGVDPSQVEREKGRYAFGQCWRVLDVFVSQG